MRKATVVVIGLVAAALAGCTPVGGTAVTPAASGTPFFASDSAALAAAKASYEAYSAVADQILADGGEGADRIDAVTTGSLQKSERQDSQNFASKGYRALGSSKVAKVILESTKPGASASTKEAVTAYVCLDISAVDIVDRSGTSVVAPGRSPLVSYEVGFDLVRSRLLPSREEKWTSTDICG
jgi:hypothetical protein